MPRRPIPEADESSGAEVVAPSIPKTGFGCVARVSESAPLSASFFAASSRDGCWLDRRREFRLVCFRYDCGRRRFRNGACKLAEIKNESEKHR
jgi:hypothetical protein